MSLRAGLLTTLLVCGCNSDAHDGATPVDASVAPVLDIAMPHLADLASPDLVVLDPPPKMMWMRQFGSALPDLANGVAADAVGNAYVVGGTDAALDGNQNAGGADAFVVKYDANGKKLWLRQFGTDSLDSADGVATDGAGNIFVAGSTYGGLDGNLNVGRWDAFLVKFDANGNKLWTGQFGSAADDFVDGVATDGTGNVFVTGHTLGGLDGNENAGRSDVFLVKYDTNGDQLWMRQFGSAAQDWESHVATDGAGNAYVTGWTQGGLDGNQNAGSDDVFLVKYDSYGNKLWTRQFGTLGPDEPNGVATDAMANVYVTGATWGALDQKQHAGGVDAFLVKYDANGKRIWIRQFGTADDDGGWGVATDGAANIFVAGYTYGGLDGNQNAGRGDAFLVRLDANGNKLWTRQFGTTAEDYARGVAVDHSGSMYVAGFTDGAFAGYQNAGDTDAFVVRFAAAP